MDEENFPVPAPGEKLNTNIEYPFEYFDVQVRFAMKWAELSGEPIDQVLIDKTALYRRITDKKPPKGELSPIWQDLVDRVTGNPEDASKIIYSIYLEQPHSQYHQPSYPENDGKHFGYFGFDHYPANDRGEKDRIKVHFLNLNRGDKSGLDSSYLPKRQNDVKRMFNYIRTQYPQAEEVIGGSWLYALKSYRDSFPIEFTQNMKQLVPMGFEHIPNSIPNMSFEGNSVWGQFVNRQGLVQKRIYDEFITHVNQAKSLDDLVEAFPDKVYQPKVSISVFYNWIDSQAKK